MWKVVIIVCALGNPCVIFEEDPIKYYQDKEPCMVVAEKKHNEITVGFLNYGYYVEYSEFKCESVGPAPVKFQ